MVEHTVLHTRELLRHIQGNMAEKAHVGQQIERMLFISCLFRGMRSKDHALLHLFETAVFLVQGKSSRHPVRFVEVNEVGFVAQLFEQLDSPAPQDYGGCDLGLRVGIVQTERGGARQKIVFLQVGGQQEQRCRTENLRIEVISLHPHLRMVDLHRKLDTCIGEELVTLLLKTYLHRLIGVATLVVITVFPQDTDPGKVLPQLIRTAHVRPGQKSQTTRIDLQALVDGVFHRKIHHAFFKTRIDLVGRRKRLG